jgi:hypothetical protein
MITLQGGMLLTYYLLTAYNNLQPHSSCDYLTPQQAHQQTGTLKKDGNLIAKQISNKNQLLLKQSLLYNPTQDSQKFCITTIRIIN